MGGHSARRATDPTGPEALDLLGAEGRQPEIRDVVDAALERPAASGRRPRGTGREPRPPSALLHEQATHVTANRDAALLNLLLELP